MRAAAELTDNEGSLLALIHRKGALSGYQIAKHYETSPIYTINTAKGKLYPLLERLVERDLLRTEEVVHDRRGTRLYACTDLGECALRIWVRSFRPEHELPPDPLRRKLQALELLDREEQISWIEQARSHVARRLQAVEAYDAQSEGPFGLLAQDNARETLRGRLRWLDHMERSILRDDH